MVLIEWIPAYSVKIKKFDEQHEKLVDLINQLHAAMKSGQGVTVIGIIIQSLVQYTYTHFADEIKLLQENGYPETVLQKAEHEKFVKELVSFQQQYHDGSVMLTMNVLMFLKEWLINHIQGEDKKYSPFLNAKGIF